MHTWLPTLQAPSNGDVMHGLARYLTTQVHAALGPSCAQQAQITWLTSQRACLAHRYTSQVYLEQPTKVVSHVYDSTLFDHLDSTWRFAPGPLPGSCWLDFNVDFAFKSPLYRHIALVFFDEVLI